VFILVLDKEIKLPLQGICTIILILDEATKTLDGRDERKIQFRIALINLKENILLMW